MGDSVIRVENLGKKYRIKHQAERQRYVALRDVLADRTTGAARRLWEAIRRQKADIQNQTSAIRPLTANPTPPTQEDFWALKDVSFEVKRGEVVGLIGRNGAGKSTLLKILSRITEPTAGRIHLRGRVASLLEVGTGFHPELTGRENIFLNGAILGMTREEIKSKFDEIVAFAEIERFLDTPVKRYSSGMYVRLAFAVAAHLEPEILIVDEVLAVGDAEFQKKCLGKMEQVSRGGRTVLFVSHNLSTVKSLCNKACLLDAGELRYSGYVEDVLRVYQERSQTSNSLVLTKFAGPLGSKFSLAGAAINGLQIRDRIAQLPDASSIALSIDYSFTCALEFVAGMSVYVDGFRLFTLHDTTSALTTQAGQTNRSTFQIPSNLLRAGRYQIAFGVREKHDASSWLWNDSIFDLLIGENAGGVDRLAHGAINVAATCVRQTNVEIA